MAIELDTLALAANRTRTRVAASINEAKQRSLRTAFLCHSHKDSTYVEGLLVVLQETGWNVYVDWQDSSMPETPNQETARKIRGRIAQADYFLFLATPNALASRWCPWEIGIADGKKDHDRILVIPTRRGSTYYGNEYVGIYRRIDFSDTGRLAAWRPNETTGGVWAAAL